MTGIAVTKPADANLTDDRYDLLPSSGQPIETIDEPRSWSDLIPSEPATDIEAFGDAATSTTFAGDSLLAKLGNLPIPSIDVTAFKSLPYEDTLSNGVLIGVMFGILVGTLLVTGLAMKLACHFTGGGRITIRRGIFASYLLSMVCAAIALVTTLTLDEPSPFYILGLQIIAGTATLAIILWQNPIRAFATGVVGSVLQAILLFGFFSATLIMIGQFVPKQKLTQLANHTQSLSDSLAKEVLPGDSEANRELLSIKSLINETSEHAKASNTPKVKLFEERGVRTNPFVQ